MPVTLYRIDELPSKQKLYKIDINAQQNHLTGTPPPADRMPRHGTARTGETG